MAKSKKNNKNRNRAKNQKKEDIKLFSILIVIIIGILVGYSFYNNYSAEDGSTTNLNTGAMGDNPPGAPEENENEDESTEEPANNPAPDFSINDLDGNPVSLSSNRGKVVVLDMMATWCGPCKTEMEHLNEIYNKYDKSEVIIMSIGIDPDESEEVLSKFKDEYNGEWIFARDTDGIGTKYSVSSIPTMVVVDKDGQITFRSEGVTPTEKLSEEIDKVI
jgi:thiol-disulfide isomerase/thioredoxin